MRPEPTTTITIRMPTRLCDRLRDVAQATDGDASRSSLTILAVEMFLASLSVCPNLVALYDPQKDASALYLGEPQDKE